MPEIPVWVQKILVTWSHVALLVSVLFVAYVVFQSVMGWLEKR
jgi:hypothetical protein